MNRIKHGLKEINIYNKENSLTLVEMFEDSANEPTQCIQLRLNDNEVKDLIRYLEAQIE